MTVAVAEDVGFLIPAVVGTFTLDLPRHRGVPALLAAMSASTSATTDGFRCAENLVPRACTD